LDWSALMNYKTISTSGTGALLAILIFTRQLRLGMWARNPQNAATAAAMPGRAARHARRTAGHALQEMFIMFYQMELVLELVVQMQILAI